MTLENKAIMDPQLTDVLNAAKLDIFRTMNVCKVGQVQSFSVSKKTAQVQLLFKRVLPNGNVTDYPVLVDCPAVTIQGGGGGIQFPISSGDQCLVFFADRNIDAWFQTGSAAAPPNARAHDLSDGFALVGVNSLVSVFSNYQSSKARFFYGGAEVDLSAGIVTIKNTLTTLGTILDGLIDVLETLQVTGPLSLTAPSIAALEAYKLQIATLLG